jgi:hypothetical protein
MKLLGFIGMSIMAFALFAGYSDMVNKFWAAATFLAGLFMIIGVTLDETEIG